jgi:hypothetical protein
MGLWISFQRKLGASFPKFASHPSSGSRRPFELPPDLLASLAERTDASEIAFSNYPPVQGIFARL